MRALIVLAVLPACVPGPVRGVVRYRLEPGHVDRGTLVFESRDEVDPWAAFRTRWRASCHPRGVHGILLDRATLQVESPTPLERLFRDDVAVSIHVRSSGAPLIEVGTADQPHGPGPLELKRTWLGPSGVREGTFLRVTAAPAADFEQQPPTRLVVTLDVRGRCAENL